MRHLLIVFLAAVVSLSGLAAQTVLLEDFDTLRQNGSGASLWQIVGQANYQTLVYEVEDGGTTISITTNGVDPNRLTQEDVLAFEFSTVAGAQRYPFPGGFTQSYLTSGTWNPLIDRMGFWLKCSKNVAWDQRQVFNIGTYIKDHQSSMPDWQGQHYYHFFNSALYADRWVHAVMTWAPNSRVSQSGSIEPDADVEFALNGEHYFDTMTRWYLNGHGPTDGTEQFECWFDKVEMWQSDGTDPDNRYVKTISAIYTGTRYEVGFNAKKNTPVTYEVRYSAASMKVNGFNSGTSGGTVNNLASAYAGVLWQSPVMAEAANGLYFAVKPTIFSEFMEIFLQPTPGGSSPPPPPPTTRLAPSGGVRMSGGVRILP